MKIKDLPKVDSIIQQTSRELIEKDTILGNDEGIAINTDRIIPPEIVEEETPSEEFVSGQKLYRTSLNYLERLQRSQDEIGKTLGGTFTNLATRAIVFNGIDLGLVDGAPQTFTWLGLRIDSSANVNYFSHFGEVDNHKKEFLMLWGLEGSYAEASIFEEDFEIDAISTVKGLALINQGVIPGAGVHKISKENQAEIETLSVSEKTKVTFRDAVNQGKIVYTPNKQFTYQKWTGLVYIVLDPVVGDGGYIIGENLNGGYTVGNFSEEMIQFFIKYHLLTGLIATIVLPTDGFTIEQGKILRWSINYEGKVAFIWPVFWNEAGTIDTAKLAPGSHPLKSEYGTDTKIEYVVEEKPNPLNIVWKDKDGLAFNYRSRAGESIEMIVLHYTAGKNADDAFNTFGTKGKGGVSSHYVIERDGTIYQLVKDEYAALHAGIDSDLTRDGIIKANERGIGIEIVNWGYLTKEGDNYITWAGSIYKPDVYGEPVHTEPWQPQPGPEAYEYWPPYTEKQYEALKALINTICATHKIPQIAFAPSPILYVVDPHDLENFKGLVGHSAIAHKWDPGPHLDWNRLLK